eukprot:TRINITY_DN1296_c1_g1_i1.p1 TRINITY_DN1296_c1_g1~~TRINITY_DN1296_c1_g1_i1.p1  ORF type:complete len:1067 (-),score=428.08 TRINITY_DN1296_c1_g1_i1:27-3227(-)
MTHSDSVSSKTSKSSKAKAEAKKRKKAEKPKPKKKLLRLSKMYRKQQWYEDEEGFLYDNRGRAVEEFWDQSQDKWVLGVAPEIGIDRPKTLEELSMESTPKAALYQEDGPLSDTKSNRIGYKVAKVIGKPAEKRKVTTSKENPAYDVHRVTKKKKKKKSLRRNTPSPNPSGRRPSSRKSTGRPASRKSVKRSKTPSNKATQSDEEQQQQQQQQHQQLQLQQHDKQHLDVVHPSHISEPSDDDHSEDQYITLDNGERVRVVGSQSKVTGMTVTRNRTQSVDSQESVDETHSRIVRRKSRDTVSPMPQFDESDEIDQEQRSTSRSSTRHQVTSTTSTVHYDNISSDKDVQALLQDQVNRKDSHSVDNNPSVDEDPQVSRKVTTRTVTTSSTTSSSTSDTPRSDNQPATVTTVTTTTGKDAGQSEEGSNDGDQPQRTVKTTRTTTTTSSTITTSDGDADKKVDTVVVVAEPSRDAHTRDHSAVPPATRPQEEEDNVEENPTKTNKPKPDLTVDTNNVRQKQKPFTVHKVETVDSANNTPVSQSTTDEEESPSPNDGEEYEYEEEEEYEDEDDTNSGTNTPQLVVSKQTIDAAASSIDGLSDHEIQEMIAKLQNEEESDDVISELLSVSEEGSRVQSRRRSSATVDILETLTNSNDQFKMALLQMFEPVILAENEFVIRKGEEADEMYFLTMGTVDVLDGKGNVLTTLGSGTFFGEIALLFETTRTVSVRAKEICTAFSLSRDAFDEVLERFPEETQKITDVAEERLEHVLETSRAVAEHESDREEEERIKKMEGRLRKYHSIKGLQRQGSVALLEQTRGMLDDEVMSEVEDEDDEDQKAAGASSTSKKTHHHHVEKKKLRDIVSGEEGAKTSSWAKLREHAKKNRLKTSSIDLFQTLLKSTCMFTETCTLFKEELLDHLEMVEFEKDNVVVEQGVIGQNMFFLMQGTMEQLNIQTGKVFRQLKAGDFFGELALLMEAERMSSVIALEHCVCYQLTKSAFQEVAKKFPDDMASLDKMTNPTHRMTTFDSNPDLMKKSDLHEKQGFLDDGSKDFFWGLTDKWRKHLEEKNK